jgi:CheY-like chemotaxis protein
MESFVEIKRAIFHGQPDEAEKRIIPMDCIMIIDDNIDIIDSLKSLLGTHYHLVSCLNYEEAQRQLTPNIKLVLLDIKMASKDGLAVFKLLREARPDLLIVFHSAYPGDSQSAAAVEQLSYNGYLTKGNYDLPALLATITEALDHPTPASPGLACMQ